MGGLVVALRMLTAFWGLDRLARWREWHTHALLQENRLPMVGQGMMHDWAVFVALEMLRQPLRWTAPCHSANLFAGYFPIGEALEDFEALLSIVDCDEIDKCIAQASLR